jgi:hypothetical protein
MKDRINELIKQSGMEDDMFPIDDGWVNPELQKYTELLIRECIIEIEKLITAKTTEIEDEYDRGAIDGLLAARHAILKNLYDI